ncbi:MAG: DUF4149 domain-containing protein [Helicobacter sp.]|nr:DUF4149 domain-containing protein [Helicobacter sp.]
MTFKIIHSIYLFIIGLCIGGIITAGVFVAPVLFGAYNFLPDLGMGTFESGILMTQIFLKLNILLNISIVAIIIYEIYVLRSFKLNFIPIILSICSIILILSFSFYYTPKIIEFKNLGAGITGSPEFAKIHIQSEIIFKIILALFVISFLWRAIQFSYKKISVDRN